MRFSFVVPCFNGVDVFKKTWDQFFLRIVSSSSELIFVNDASTDHTKEWLDTLTDPCVKVITNISNLGYAKSNNIGVIQASGEILILLNNDLEFNKEWLALLDIFQASHVNLIHWHCSLGFACLFEFD